MDKDDAYMMIRCAYDYLKPKIEDAFSMRLDLPLIKDDWRSFMRRHSLEGIDSAIIDQKQHSAPGLEYVSIGDTRQILFNSYSTQWNEDFLPDYRCCHEILHGVFFEVYNKGRIPDRKSDELEMFCEGFSEYGALKIFSHLYPREKEKIDEIVGGFDEGFDFRYQAFLKNGFLDLCYSSYSAGYCFFEDGLDESEDIDDLVRFTTRWRYKNQSVLQWCVRRYLKEQFYYNFNDISEVPILHYCDDLKTFHDRPSLPRQSIPFIVHLNEQYDRFPNLDKEILKHLGYIPEE